MARYEVLFKVGDSGGHVDGAILAYQPAGAAITPAEWQAWVDDELAEPTAFLAAMTPIRAAWYRTRRNRAELAKTATPAEFWAECTGMPVPVPDTANEVQRYWDEFQAGEANILSVGEDSNWGALDLTEHGVLTLEAPELNFYAACEPKYEVRGNQDPEWVAKRAYKFRYDLALPAQAVAALRNAQLHIPVDRGAAADVFDLLTYIEPI